MRRILRPRAFPAGLLVAALGVLPLWSQSGGDPLDLAAAAIGAARPGSFTYSGSGSAYALGLDANGETTRAYTRIVDYSESVGAEGGPRVEATRRAEGAGTPETRVLDLERPWAEQAALWLNPRVFLRRAVQGGIRTEAVTELGLDYTVVSFETPSGHTVSGYIDPDNLLRRVRTRIEHPVLGEQEVEGVYLDYSDHDGVRFPGLLVHKMNGSPTLVIVVKDVRFGEGA
jgi:hypothetical protein